MTMRIRPGDQFADLQRRAGEALAREHATGDQDAAWSALREIDQELWPVIRAALAQCAGLPREDGSQSNATGKLHPEIAKLLSDAIEAGLAGKLPPSWPEPTGHRAVWRNEAEPPAVAALYKAAVEQGLIHDPVPTKRIAEMFGVTDRMPPDWCTQYPVKIATDAAGCVVLSCGGLTIYHNSAGRTPLALLLDRELKKAASQYCRDKGKTKR